MLLVEGALIRRLLYNKEVVIHVAVHIDRLRPTQCCALCVPWLWNYLIQIIADWGSPEQRGWRQLSHGITHYATCTSLPLSKTQSEILIKTSLLFKMTTRAVLRKSCKVLRDQNEIPFPWTIPAWCTVPSLDA